MSVNWNEVLDSGSFVKLTNGIAKTLVLRNARPQTKFENDDGTTKKGVTFDVIEEDGKPCEKEWTVTAMRALGKLGPLCEQAETEGKEDIKVRVTRAGEGRQTVYEIKPVA
jgi:hypothetical protein